jgi:competence CoiA-like predicted nuclease
MSERQESPYDSIARSWLALIERRQESIVELCHSGRWRHYYTHPEFLEEMRKVLELRNRWARLAGLPVGEQINIRTNVQERAPDTKRPSVNHGGTAPERRPTSAALLAAVPARF